MWAWWGVIYLRKLKENQGWIWVNTRTCLKCVCKMWQSCLCGPPTWRWWLMIQVRVGKNCLRHVNSCKLLGTLALHFQFLWSPVQSEYLTIDVVNIKEAHLEEVMSFLSEKNVFYLLDIPAFLPLFPWLWVLFNSSGHFISTPQWCLLCSRAVILLCWVESLLVMIEKFVRKGLYVYHLGQRVRTYNTGRQ